MLERWILAGLVGLTVAGLPPTRHARARGSAAATGVAAMAQSAVTGRSDWSVHNLDLYNSRFSPLDEINASNVGRLTVKWSTQVGDKENINQVTPLVVNGVMYFNAGSKLYARNAATGQELWTTQVEPAFTGSGARPRYSRRPYLRVRTTRLSTRLTRRRAHHRIVWQQGAAAGRGRGHAVWKLPHDATGYSMMTPPAFHNGTLYFGLATSESHIPGGLVGRRRRQERRREVGVQDHPARSTRRGVGRGQGHMAGWSPAGWRGLDHAGDR